ncbi:MAG: MarR family transcriptional regulator [Leptospiraceae bacterium]|nr:MarR family transcriptional regulator [Leptospiraceae bacterium]MCP5499315.1 MarR family transcriptional regulator [Leptospiraceae bacterium]
MNEDLDNNNCFYFSLSIAFRSVNRVMEHTLKKVGLTPVQFLALKGLYDRDGMTIKELSEMLVQDSTSITRLVDRLEKAGLVIRKTDSNDKRSINVFLSEKAKSYAPKAKKIWRRVNRLLERNFQEQDLIGFFNVMEKMRGLSYLKENANKKIGEFDGRN